MSRRRSGQRAQGSLQTSFLERHMLPEALSRKLFATHNGVEVSRLVKRLMKLGRENPEPVIKILMEYTRLGPVEHWRASMIPYIVELLREDQAEYCSWFE